MHNFFIPGVGPGHEGGTCVRCHPGLQIWTLFLPITNTLFWIYLITIPIISLFWFNSCIPSTTASAQMKHILHISLSEFYMNSEKSLLIPWSFCHLQYYTPLQKMSRICIPRCHGKTVMGNKWISCQIWFENNHRQRISSYSMLTNVTLESPAPA